MTTVNMNARISFIETPAGAERFRKSHAELVDLLSIHNLDAPRFTEYRNKFRGDDPNRVYMLLWQAIEIYGPLISASSTVPFVDNSFRIEE
jgi:hypothetical protein